MLKQTCIHSLVVLAALAISACAEDADLTPSTVATGGGAGDGSGDGGASDGTVGVGIIDGGIAAGGEGGDETQICLSEDPPIWCAGGEFVDRDLHPACPYRYRLRG